MITDFRSVLMFDLFSPSHLIFIHEISHFIVVLLEHKTMKAQPLKSASAGEGGYFYLRVASRG
jgi:hypothetical protein